MLVVGKTCGKQRKMVNLRGLGVGFLFCRKLGSPSPAQSVTLQGSQRS